MGARLALLRGHHASTSGPENPERLPDCQALTRLPTLPNQRLRASSFPLLVLSGAFSAVVGRAARSLNKPFFRAEASNTGVPLPYY